MHEKEFVWNKPTNSPWKIVKIFQISRVKLLKQSWENLKNLQNFECKYKTNSRRNRVSNYKRAEK